MSKRIRKPKAIGNDIAKLLKMHDNLEIMPQAGSVTHVQVLHDDWCSIFAGKPCSCNPDIVAPNSAKSHLN